MIASLATCKSCTLNSLHIVGGTTSSPAPPATSVIVIARGSVVCPVVSSVSPYVGHLTVTPTKITNKNDSVGR